MMRRRAAVFSRRRSFIRRRWREVAGLAGAALLAGAVVAVYVDGERCGGPDGAPVPSGIAGGGAWQEELAADGPTENSATDGLAADGPEVDGAAGGDPAAESLATQGSAVHRAATDGPAEEGRSTDAPPTDSAATFGPSPLPTVFESLSPEGQMAEGFRACMVGAGVPISAVAMPDGGLYVGFFWQDVESALGRDPAGRVSWAVLSENRDPRQVLAKTVAERGGGYVLQVNGADMSGPFETCHGQYPYVHPDHENNWDPIAEYVQEAERVAAASTWATCARANGFPDVADPADQVVDGKSSVEVVIPLTTEPEAFATLLSECPPAISVSDYRVQVDV
ncbi:MAG: hypothetical protein LBK59_08560, partial [Bifidobacteriaceae bacterium]|nr:hypothetical protein [Bifidobacteriaceae bacterium]